VDDEEVRDIKEGARPKFSKSAGETSGVAAVSLQDRVPARRFRAVGTSDGGYFSSV